jgi:hypothetical protein
MRTASVVAVLSSCAVLGNPQGASAAGSYGAVVERGVRDCRTAPHSTLVVCFESRSVNSDYRDIFLRAWRARPPTLTPWNGAATMLRVRAVSATGTSAPSDRAVLRYLARADHLTGDLLCRENFRFRFEASQRVVRMGSFTSTCEPPRNGMTSTGPFH